MLAALAALLAVGTLSSAAHAAPAKINADATDLSLAGERVVFAQASDGGGARVYAQTPGGGRTRIATLDRLRTKRFGRVELGYAIDASANRFAMLRDDTHSFVARNERDPRLDFFRRTLTSARLGAKPSLKRTCSPPIGTPIDSNGLRPAKLKLEGDGLASFGLDCRGEKLEVRNLDSGSKRRFDLASGSFEQFDIAGSFLVYRERSGDEQARLRIVDWTTGAELYRLDLVKLIPIPTQDVGARLQEPTMQADGKVAVRLDSFNESDSDPCQTVIVWFSPQEQFPHVVDPGACVPSATSFPESLDDFLRLAGDRIATVVKVGRERQLVTTDLAGGDVRRFARFTSADQLVAFDYDGQRIAWADGECGRIHVASAAGEPAPVAPPNCD